MKAKIEERYKSQFQEYIDDKVEMCTAEYQLGLDSASPSF